MATYTLRRVARVTTGATIDPALPIDTGDVFMAAWRLTDNTVVEHEVTAEEYAATCKAGGGILPNRSGDPSAVYLGGYSRPRFNTPSTRLEPGDLYELPAKTNRDGTAIAARVKVAVPEYKAGRVTVVRDELAGNLNNLRTLRLTRSDVTIADGTITVP